MNLRIGLLVFAFIMLGCGGSGKPPVALAKPSIKTPIKLHTVIPYAKGNHIATNIKAECELNRQLSEFIKQFSEKNGMTIVRTPRISRKNKGHVLMVEITDAISSGNAFIGHRKYTQIKGTLYKNGKKLASFTGQRHSMGGMWGAYKGSCSVLGRTVKTLGSDVARWLHSPQDGIQLGD